jgi:uncharacterized membrane protein
MINRYINNSIYGVDNFFKDDRWLYRLKINDYQVVTIIWNVALVLVPWAAALLLARFISKADLRKPGYKLLFVLLFGVWLIFMPNTAYIISDVRHLLNYCPVDSRFQVCEENAWTIFFFFSYAAFGWVSFVYLLRQMKTVISSLIGRWAGFVFEVMVIPVLALGVLLGLVNRWNSWELFIYPTALFKTIAIYWTESQSLTNWLIFSIFLYILYYSGRWLFKDRFN